MIFHAKALEMYTLCFQNLNSISEEDDLEVKLDFGSVLKTCRLWLMKIVLIYDTIIYFDYSFNI